MSKKYRVGVIGATGVVGSEIVKILESCKFPVSQLRLFASERSLGHSVGFNGKQVDVEVF